MNEDLEGNLNKKRKISIHVEEEVTGRDDMADLPEREVGNVVVLVDNVADLSPKGELGFEAPEEGIFIMADPLTTESGREKLKELRKRMQAKKRKSSTIWKSRNKIRSDISSLWRETEGVVVKNGCRGKQRQVHQSSKQD